MTTVYVQKLNQSFLKVVSDEVGVLFELSDHFSFEVPGARYQPKVKAGVWDGKIRLFNIGKKVLPGGLYYELTEFCKARDYDIEMVDNPRYGLPNQELNLTPEEIANFVKELNLPIEIRDYQYSAIFKALKFKKRTIVCPTGSGKSAIIYSIVRFLLETDPEFKVLLIVPTINLVSQMEKNFVEYSVNNGWEDQTQTISAGKSKKIVCPVCISTWQSATKQQDVWFQQFDAVIIDECHLAKSTEISKIMERSTEAAYRLGFTGSLDNSKTHKMCIKGLLGDIDKVASTKELMERGMLSDLKIKCLILDYSKEVKSLCKNFDYHTEINWLIQNTNRNRFIRNLALQTEGNTLILYNFVEKHGDVLYEMLQKKVGDRRLFYVHGGVDAEDREEVRSIMAQSKNAIVLASYGCFSTGVDIPSLENVILASPTKSVIRLLQSIGRGLRLSKGKIACNLFDVADKISNKKSGNHTYKHMIERLKIYTKEEFSYKIVEVSID